MPLFSGSMTAKKILPYLVIAIFCSPLLFINLKSSHDWGDDFAQYIHQAKNITEGIPQAQTGYIFNPQNFLGPPAYPVGFPLLLAPLYKFFGINIKAFTFLVSCFAYLLCFVAYGFFRHFFSAIASVLLVLLLAWNPEIWDFKMEVMSDLPFSFFFMLCVLLYVNRRKESVTQAVLIGILGAFLASIRTIGIVFPLAVLCEAALDSIRNYRVEKKFPARKGYVFPAIFILAFGMGYVLVNKIFFPLPSGNMQQYPTLVDTKNFAEVVLGNTFYNAEMVQNFFTGLVRSWKIMTIITGSAVIIFLLLGMSVKFFRKMDFVDFIFLLYAGAIIIFPFGNAGFRFILPVIPVMMYYMVEGLKAVPFIMKWKPKYVAAAFAAFILLQYSTLDIQIYNVQQSPIPGPYDKTSLDAFDYIRKHTPQNTVIVFAKPRALALYTGRQGFANEEKDDTVGMHQKLFSVHAGYFLVHSEISDSSLRIYSSDSTRATLLWSNDRFRLYKEKGW